MSYVHYRFKSAVTFETVTFDGMHISVADLKKAISQQKNLGKFKEAFDLQLTRPQSTEVYKDTDLIPRNSSVIVARIPVERSSRSRPWDSSRVDMSTAQSAQKAAEASSQEKLQRSADLVNMKGSEEEKVKRMIEQSGKDYSQTNYVKPRYPTGPPPRNYVCYRCGQPGHFINACPNRDEGEMLPRVKRSTGIPNSFMTPVVDPHAPGVLLTNSGQLAVPTLDAIAYMQGGKKEKPPFVKSDSPERKQEEKIIPGELLCPVCKDLLTDAVVAPCCGNSACDECIRDALLDSDEHVCPLCKESGISPDALIPNKFMRTAVNNFQNETGYTTIKRRNQEATQETVPQVPKAAPKREPERQKNILPPHLVGMPPQVIKAAQAEIASKESHTAASSDFLHDRESISSVPISSQPMIKDLGGGYAGPGVASAYPSGSVPLTAIRTSFVQSSVTGTGMPLSHSAQGLIQVSQGSSGEYQPQNAYLDERGILRHAVPPMRPRLVHASGRPWPPGPVTRGGVLMPGRGGQRVMVFRSSTSGPRRLGPPPSSSGEHRFPPQAAEHRFPAPPAASPVPPNQIPGHAPPQRMQGRMPTQQTPPGMNQPVPGIIRIPAPMHTSGPAPPIMFNRGPPPQGPVPRLMAQDILIAPAPAFVPPLIPPAGVNLPPPVPLTEEEFYREKERLLELERKKKTAEPTPSTVSRKKADPLDDFEELLQKKSRSKAAPPFRSPRSRSRSRTRSRSRSFTKSKTRSRSCSITKRTRSISRSRSRSLIKSPLHRSRSLSRSRSKSQSRSRPFMRSKSRSRSRYASRKKSFTPKRSLTPLRKYSRTQSRSPPPKRRRSRSFSRSPRPRSRTRSRSLARNSKRVSHSVSRSLSRSPLPRKRHSRTPVSHGRTPQPTQSKRHQRKSPSPRGRSGDGAYGASQPRHRPGDSSGLRYSPDKVRGGYGSPPRYDERPYYRYDPRWTDYYRMLQEWYAKCGNFGQGFPSVYEHHGRTHSRGYPRSRSRSHSPRPQKRSRSPDDTSRWRREKSLKRLRLDPKDKLRAGRDEIRRSQDRARDRDRRKDVRATMTKSDKDRSRASFEPERLQRTSHKADRRREEEYDSQHRSVEREEPKQQLLRKSHARDDVAEGSVDRGRKIASKSPWEREKLETREETSVIPVIGGGISRQNSTSQVGYETAERGLPREGGRVEKVEVQRESGGMVKEEVQPRSKEPGREERKRVNKDSQQVKTEDSELLDQKIDHRSREPDLMDQKMDHRLQDSELMDQKRDHRWQDPELADQKIDHKPRNSELMDQKLDHRPKDLELTDQNLDHRYRDMQSGSTTLDKVISKETSEEFNSSPTSGQAQPRDKKTCAPEVKASKVVSKTSGQEERASVKEKLEKNDLPSTKEKPFAKDITEGRQKHSDHQEIRVKSSTPSAQEVLIANVPSASKWESNQSDSDTEVPQAKLQQKNKERTTSLPRSVLESAENAIRHRSRPSLVSAAHPHQPRSSVHRISTDSKSPPPPPKKSEKSQKTQRDEKHQEASSSHSRKVVQGPTSFSMKVTVSSDARDTTRHKEDRDVHCTGKRSHSPSPAVSQDVRKSGGVVDTRRVKENARIESGNTRHEDEIKATKKSGPESSKRASRAAVTSKDEVSKKSSSIRDRKASVFVDEDKFEPDYNESGSSDYEQQPEKNRHMNQSESRRRESSSETEEIKTKQKKRHKKHKKQKKHKEKSRKDS